MQLSKAITVIIFSSYLLTCSAPTSIDAYSGDSYPQQPLRSSSAKVKTETSYQYNTHELQSITSYTYNAAGLVQSKITTGEADYIYQATQYFYNADQKLCKEICDADTIFYHYEQDRLVQKITVYNSAPAFMQTDTTFYFYNADGTLAEITSKNRFSDYTTRNAEKYTYADGLRIQKQLYYNDELNRTIEYDYYNRILTEVRVYMATGMLEYLYKYYYADGLLRAEKGYWGDGVTEDSKILYSYNSRHELIQKIIHQPVFSSSTDSIIYYEYF